MEMFYHHKPWIKYISGFRVKAPWQKKKDIQASKMKENLILNCRKKCEYREDRDKIREFNRERLHILIMPCWWIQTWISINWDKMLQMSNYNVVGKCHNIMQTTYRCFKIWRYTNISHHNQHVSSPQVPTGHLRL